jgi:restriction system protein
VILPDQETLDSWLQRMMSPGSDRAKFMSCCFPTNAIGLEYLETVHARSADEVLRLAATILDGIQCVGSDREELHRLFDDPESASVLALPPYDYRRRLLLSVGRRVTPRDGILWVLRIAEHWPREALNAIQAFFLAHCLELPDGRLNGLEDVEAMIRQRFIAKANEGDISARALASLSKREFEFLVAELYSKMGYEVTVSCGSRDGGVDVVAAKSDAGGRRRIAVQCKLPDKHNVPVEVVRELLGVAVRPTYTSCAVVTSRRFTRAARTEFGEDQRVELIDGDTLRVLMNEHLGPAWPRELGKIIRQREA